MTWSLTGANSTVSGFSSPSAVSSSSQNGAAAGTLTSMTVQPNGTVAASFSNGKTVDFAQIALAQFENQGGLAATGQGLYQATAVSGNGTVSAAGSGGSGTLIGGALEGSNVDLAGELTQIITYQRAYQANAKMITTTDQILQQVMAMTQ
jgi:flagellar hook protein FlgE